MLVGLRVHVRPEGETVDDSATVPVNPFTGAIVIVDVAVAPASIWAGETGPAAIEKSVTWNVTVAV